MCPRCKREVYEIGAFKVKEGRLPRKRARHRDLDKWKARCKADFLFIEEAEKKLPRDTRPMVFVSEATLRWAQDVSRQVERTIRLQSQQGYC